MNFQVGKLHLSSFGLGHDAERLPSLGTRSSKSGLTDLTKGVKLC